MERGRSISNRLKAKSFRQGKPNDLWQHLILIPDRCDFAGLPPTALQHYFDWEFPASMILPFLVTFPAPETWPVMWRSHRVRQWQAQAPIARLLLRWTHFGSPNLFGYGSGNERIDLNEEKTEIQRLCVAKGQGRLFIEPSEQTPAWLFESRWGDTSEDSRAKGACSSDWAC